MLRAPFGNVRCRNARRSNEISALAAQTVAPMSQCLRRLVLAFAFLLGGFGAGVWLGRETLLRGLTDFWIVSDPVTRGDAVVVLGGGLEYRPLTAADLYKKGL